jgi:hypothetical protein
MHSGRFACLLLGVWLAGCLFMAFISRQNLDTADRLIANGDPAILLHSGSAGIQAMRGLLRYHALEQTRAANESWETAQVVLGIFFFFFLLFGTREDKRTLAIPLLMVLVALAERLLLTPEITSRARLLDFVRQGSHAADRVKLLVLQRVYLGCELGKAALGLILAARLILARPRKSPGDIRQELNLVDKANYRHING